MKNKYNNEKVYVVPFNKLKDIEDKFTPFNEDSVNIINLIESNGQYIYRYEAEGHAEMQQKIPYVELFDEEGKKIFTTRRIGGDKRLINKLSIGCGGHINLEDIGDSKVFNCAIRELEEELNFIPLKMIKCIGTIRDITSATNDHTGVVLTMTAKNITVKEVESLEGTWQS